MVIQSAAVSGQLSRTEERSMMSLRFIRHFCCCFSVSLGSRSHWLSLHWHLVVILKNMTWAMELVTVWWCFYYFIILHLAPGGLYVWSMQSEERDKMNNTTMSVAAYNDSIVNVSLYLKFVFLFDHCLLLSYVRDNIWKRSLTYPLLMLIAIPAIEMEFRIQKCSTLCSS